MVRELLLSCGVWHPERAGSVVAVCGLSSCGTWAQLPCGMWDLSSLTRDQTRIPSLEGGFLTTGPPGKSPIQPFRELFISFQCLHFLFLKVNIPLFF